MTGWLLEQRARLRRLDRRRPWLLDSAVAVAILLFTLPSLFGPHSEPQPSPVVLAVAVAALIVPLWWRRRRPVEAFVVAAVVLFTEWALDIWIATGIVLLVLLYEVAARASMRALGGAVAATAVLLFVSVYLLQLATEHRLAILLLLAGTFAGAVAAGLAVRTRRAYLAALEDRAARLEVERDQRARLAVADERARVAREMHDIVGHHVSVIVGLSDGAAVLATGRGEQTAEPLRLIGETGRQALSELRTVVGVLREEEDGPELGPQPGVADLDRLLPSVRAAGVPVTLRTSGELRTLGRGLQLAVYRIVQESLTNVLKHAGRGATAEVTVAAGDDGVRITVRDNGIGRSGPENPRLVGMRERAALYGGTVAAGPTTDGWLVDVLLKEPA
ncbi:sensor histidine kinase [Paractinoplanes globisporus]|uniref:histidine kinase n=1 Tax=Paractinoplanes globisporus TaxID=113565 RepID=A0ABW6WFV8_9ACTN|nr:histidine kinase [Actinoplanes globisporus]